MEWHLHRYGRSYGDKRDVHRRPGEGENYNVQRKEADMVYTFKYVAQLSFVLLRTLCREVPSGAPPWPLLPKSWW